MISVFNVHWWFRLISNTKSNHVVGFHFINTSPDNASYCCQRTQGNPLGKKRLHCFPMVQLMKEIIQESRGNLLCIWYSALPFVKFRYWSWLWKYSAEPTYKYRFALCQFLLIIILVLRQRQQRFLSPK